MSTGLLSVMAGDVAPGTIDRSTHGSRFFRSGGVPSTKGRHRRRSEIEFGVHTRRNRPELVPQRSPVARSRYSHSARGGSPIPNVDTSNNVLDARHNVSVDFAHTAAPYVNAVPDRAISARIF